MIQDNGAKWQVKKLTDFASNNALPVGHIYQTINPTVPLGSLPLFGGEYNRTLYADLWSWANEQPNFVVSEGEWQSIANANGGNVPKFSTGNGTTTFRVPSLKCWVKGANGVEEVGSYLQAGLPNIEGKLAGNRLGISSAVGGHGYGVGCFQGGISDGRGLLDEHNYGAAMDDGLSNSVALIQFNAKYSNPTYGNSDTVQPPSLVGMWCIVAYGTISNVGSVDVGNVMQAVEQVQTDLNDRQIKTYTSLEQLGLTQLCNAFDIAYSLPTFSSLLITVDTNTHSNLLVPNDGALTVKKDSGEGSVEFSLHTYWGDYKANFSSWTNPQFSGWKRVATNGALSMPSENKIILSPPVSGGSIEYIAPADGYLAILIVNANGLFAVWDSHGENTVSVQVEAHGGFRDFVPIRKGAHVEIRMTYAGSTSDATLHFYYAQSEV